MYSLLDEKGRCAMFAIQKSFPREESFARSDWFILSFVCDSNAAFDAVVWIW